MFKQARPSQAMRRAATARVARPLFTSQVTRSSKYTAPCSGDVTYLVDASADAFQVDLLKITPKQIGEVIDMRNAEREVARYQSTLRAMHFRRA